MSREPYISERPAEPYLRYVRLLGGAYPVYLFHDLHQADGWQYIGRGWI